MRVQLDRKACSGHAVCRDICPQVFAIAEDGLAVLLQEEPDPELEDAVSEAIEACPEAAIRWTA